MHQDTHLADRRGRSSLNFFQCDHVCVMVASSQPPPACLQGNKMSQSYEAHECNRHIIVLLANNGMCETEATVTSEIGNSR